MVSDPMNLQAPPAISTFTLLRERLNDQFTKVPPLKVGVVCSHEFNVLRAVCEVRNQGWIEPILFGDEKSTRDICEDNNLDLTGVKVIDKRDPREAIKEASSLALTGGIDIFMRGRLSVYRLLHELCKRSNNIRQSTDLLTHVAVFELAKYPRLLLLSDGGVVIAPTLDQKVRIVNQTIDVALALGIDKPKVALLAAVETVLSYLPINLEEAAIAKMGERGQIGRAIIDGPLAFDVAVSEESAAIKKISSPVAGKADILIVPHIEAGNSIYQALVVFARAKAAGVVIGARFPIVITARTDSHVNRVNSIHLAIWLKLNQV